MRTISRKLPLAFGCTICILSFFLSAEAAPAIDPGYGHEYQTPLSDSSLVLQACLDMPGLQSFYVKNPDDSYKPVYIMQAPIAFPAGLSVSKFQQDVIFESRAGIYSNNRDAFVIVKSFLIEGSVAKVAFDYNYHYTTTPAAFEVILTLEKNGADWTITNTTTSQR
jgi:hypothetical protein